MGKHWRQWQLPCTQGNGTRVHTFFRLLWAIKQAEGSFCCGRKEQLKREQPKTRRHALMVSACAFSYNFMTHHEVGLENKFNRRKLRLQLGVRKITVGEHALSPLDLA